MHRRFSIAPILAASILLVIPRVVIAGSYSLIWNGGDGPWFSNNWSLPAVQPSGFADVAIDNGNRVRSNVTLVGDGSAGSLRIDGGDQLIIGDSTPNSISTFKTTTLTNNGLISPGANQYDNLIVNGALTNYGTIECDNNSIMRISASTFINNGILDVSRRPGDLFAAAELNATNVPLGMYGYGSGSISVHDGGTLSIMNPASLVLDGNLNADSAGPCILINATFGLRVAGLTGRGPITTNGAVAYLNLGGSYPAPSNYSGTLSGNISIQKDSNGTQIFSGNNSYTGPTDIYSEALQLDNTNIAHGGAGTGNMTVHSDGTLAGIGSTQCPVTVESGGTLSPGDHAGYDGGTFTVGASLLLQPGANLRFDLSSSLGASDLLRVSGGEFEASGVNITVTPHGNLAWHHLYTLLNWTGAVQTNGNVIDDSNFVLVPPKGILGNIVVDNLADTVSFYVLANLGDANMDGKVDLNDLNVVLNNLGRADTNWTDGAFDSNPTIDINDLNAVLNNLGVNSSASTAVAAAQALLAAASPEPASLTLLTITLPLLITRRRRIA